jgi:phosphoenolpyruvate carboxylase
MSKNDRAEQMVQHLRTLSLTYAANHYDYIESLKGTDTEHIFQCRMKMVRSYKELDSVSRAIKACLVNREENVIPLPTQDQSWGKLINILAKKAETEELY